MVTAAVERVFACVADLHDAALAALGAGEPTARAGATDLESAPGELLAAPGQLAVGLGLVAAPRPDRDVRLLWWQADPDGGRIAALRPDLRPASLDFYDYTATEWFDVPRRTGRRHVVGPYVDVHGTGRYLLTLTAPVVGEGEFLGVVGADVPVNRFENHLLRALDPGADAPFRWCSTRRAGSSCPRRRAGWSATCSTRRRRGGPTCRCPAAVPGGGRPRRGRPVPA